MTPDERELRRALEGRSGEPSVQFRARLTAAFDEGRPASGLMQAVAIVAVIAITLGTVGALLLSRNARNVAHQGPVSGSRLSTPVASGSRLASPTASPIAMPTTTQLSAPSGNVVWAFVGGGSLFRSTNRGDTWEPRSLPPTKPAGFQEISFIDAQQGWYLTGPAYQTECRGAETQIWHTNDGAVNWQKVAVGMWTLSYKSDNVGGDQCKEKLSFIDPMHGFIAAWATGRHPTIYRTLDGGKNWAGADLPDPPDFKTGPGFSLRAGLVRQFGTTLYVIAWGKQGGDIPDRQYLFRSTDGGNTWSWLTKVPSSYIVMVSESRWLQLVVPGQSMESTSSGQQWHPYASDFNTDTPVGGPQIVFADSQIGYAEGRGALQRTQDGGQHWERVATPMTAVAGICSDQPSGPAAAPSGDNFKVVVRVPTGWTASVPVQGENILLVLNAPSSYSYQPTTISIFSFIGMYTSETLEQIAANFYGGQISNLVGQVTRCTAAGEQAVFFKYAQGERDGYVYGDHAGYWVLLVHHRYLYGVHLEGKGGIDPRAWQDAKKVLGSWTWTVSDPARP